MTLALELSPSLFPVPMGLTVTIGAAFEPVSIGGTMTSVRGAKVCTTVARLSFKPGTFVPMLGKGWTSIGQATVRPRTGICCYGQPPVSVASGTDTGIKEQKEYWGSVPWVVRSLSRQANPLH